jgi:dihydropteroate synthase
LDLNKSKVKSKKVIADGYSQNVVEWPKGRLDFSAGCLVMGILNVTPDSFSDGGQFFDPGKAVEHGLQMAADGAAIIDVGGESTRPGSDSVSVDEQIRRVIPVIEALCEETDMPVSIDTYKYEVAQAALDAGAAIINDITALSDERVGELAAGRRVPVVLMHMQGTPATMQIEPKYDDVVGEVLEFLLDRAKRAEKFGIPKDMIFIDPGIGFGKTTEHNLSLLRDIDKFVATGYRVLVGTSRKRFIGQITGKEKPAERIFGTAATVALCVAAGVSIVRVHDVAEMVDVVAVAHKIKSGNRSIRFFNCCPACGSSDITFDDNKKFSCRKCAFTYFHNVAAAVGAILEYDKKIVLIKRAKEPGKDKLDLPGGFVDPKESAEEAVIREVKEELKIDLKEPKYLGSYPNIYKYEDVLYHTCDLFFYYKIDSLPTDFDRKEIKDLVVINPLEIPDDEIAFESVKMGIGIFKSSKLYIEREAQ